MTYRSKRIEVALLLEAINKASVREKSIRHGHPRTLKLGAGRSWGRAAPFSQGTLLPVLGHAEGRCSASRSRFDYRRPLPDGDGGRAASGADARAAR